MTAQSWKSTSFLKGDSTTNWKLCCLCQADTRERLVDASGASYVTLATNIPEFYKLNAMPIPFHPKRLDEGDGILQTFKNNKTTYHESYMLKFKITKLERKRKSLCMTKEDDSQSEKNSHIEARRQVKKLLKNLKMRKKDSALFVTNQHQSMIYDWP